MTSQTDQTNPSDQSGSGGELSGSGGEQSGSGGEQSGSGGEQSGSRGEGDRLSALDTILAQVAKRDVEAGERSADRLAAAEHFRAAFAEACVTQVRPAMETVIARLRANGGGGSIEQHPGGEPRFRSPSLVAWLSLEGEISGEPRQDREPYLQLEADMDALEINVVEGDMWRGGGGHRSGRVGTWQVADLTEDRVIAELVDIARRSAQ